MSTSTLDRSALSGREKELIRHEIDIVASGVGDIHLHIQQGQRTGAYNDLARLSARMEILDAVGWYYGDDAYGPITDAVRDEAGAMAEGVAVSIEKGEVVGEDVDEACKLIDALEWLARTEETA